MPHIAKSPHSHVGKVIGTGHCVPLVQHATGVPHTSQWRRGAAARDGQLEPGTIIATFDPSGKYGNHTDGRSHAAIFLAQEPGGLSVIDQWKGRAAGLRLIRFKNGAGPAADDGDQYFVVET